VGFGGNDFPNQRRLDVFGDTDFDSNAEQMMNPRGRKNA
jgi:hypothetical protein